MLELLRYGFFSRALLAGGFVAIACALLGVFLVLRRDAMIGHGLAHVTFAGVALGLLLNQIPLVIALAMAILAGLLITELKDRAGLYGDTAIAIFSSTGFALGILIASLKGSFNVDLFGYLFGEILAIAPAEVMMSVGLGLAVVAVTLTQHRRFMFMTFDRETARVSGIPVRRYETLLTVLTAVTVVLGMKVVGLLLVAALLVIPAAAGLQLARSFREALILSSAASLTAVTGGLLIAFFLDWPASAAIVLLAALLFLGAFMIRRRGGGS
jgi:zinc transport system permease protein